MRTQYCRDHIDDVAESCGLEDSAIAEVKRATMFVEEHPNLLGCYTNTILTLMRIPDPEVKALTISHAENILSVKTPTGGQKTKRLYENQIRDFKANFERQVNIERKKAAEIERKKAEVEYKRIKEIADAEEKRRKDAESLGVVLKVEDPKLEKTKAVVIKELNRLKELLEDQMVRRAEQERILGGAEIRYSVAVKRVDKCKKALKESEIVARDAAGYRTSVIKEIQLIDKNSRNVAEQIAAQTKKLQV